MLHPAMRVLSRASPAALPAAGLAAPSQTPPKSPEQDPQRPATFRTEGNFVRVDVHPAIGGKPLDDLQQGDFDLLAGGRLQTIAPFEQVRIRAGVGAGDYVIETNADAAGSEGPTLTAIRVTR